MMKRLAVFVEGYTEVLFIEKLVVEIAGINNVVIEKNRISGGSNVPKTIIQLEAKKNITNEKYYVLIVDCGGDHQVKARINEEHENLTKAGYQKILGIRDVRPDYSLPEIPKLEEGLRKYIKTKLIPVDFILAVMEIESWFLAEHNHFKEIDSSLTTEKILHSLGFNPELDDLTTRQEPRSDMEKIYGLAGKIYTKPAKDTINVLDYARIYTDLPARFEHLEKLMQNIDDFLK